MSARRILVVTLILALVGALWGAVLGALIGFAMGVVRLGQSVEGAALTMVTTAGGGAALGAVLAPLTAWLLLRYVPLGRALGYTTLGTTVGAAAGLAAAGLAVARTDWWLWGALIGFALAAIWLRVFTKAPRPAVDSPPSGPEEPAT
jgi:hypothetical protein